MGFDTYRHKRRGLCQGLLARGCSLVHAGKSTAQMQLVTDHQWRNAWVPTPTVNL